jgi:RNA binding exosome subunit
MSAIDEYLEARRAAQKISARISVFKNELQIFAVALDGSPHNALPQIPLTWLPREDLQRLLQDAVEAFDQMHALYLRLPDDQQAHVSKPLEKFREVRGYA